MGTYGSYIFCVLLGIALVTALSSTLCLYATFLACFLLPLSVCLCINLMVLLYKEHGLPNPLVNNWLISSVITGIRRVYNTPVKSRLHITKDIVLGIRSPLNLLNSRYVSFWAICLVSFGKAICTAHLLLVSGPRINPLQQFT